MLVCNHILVFAIFSFWRGLQVPQQRPVEIFETVDRAQGVVLGLCVLFLSSIFVMGAAYYDWERNIAILVLLEKVNDFSVDFGHFFL